MKIKIDDIPEDGLHLSFSGDEDFLAEAISAIPKSQDVTVDPHIRGKIELFRSDESVSLSGTVLGSIDLICSRCLFHFNLEKELNLDLKLRGGDIDGEFREAAEKEEQDTIFLDGAELDPAEIILQEILLEIPMKPLCREDCAGLCPKCGALKGSPECKCSDEKPMDPRWEVLARLKEKPHDKLKG